MSSQGNDPARWEKILNELDEKLQFGTLERLRRVSSYHFEGDALIIALERADDFEYLSKASTKTQLQIFAQDASRVTSIEVKKV
jgi:hypothetical protein